MKKANIGHVDNIVNNQDIIDFCSEKLGIAKELANEKLSDYNLLQDERGYMEYYLEELEYFIKLPYYYSGLHKNEEEYKDYIKYKTILVDFLKFNEINYIYLEQ